ncbi:MAG: hypothetical protein KatS3mg060_0184 [Dehalococcoidia bacterium]|nr:MAG: hypothetical protein KatS3mg060_0184 [Dehalococcoidia bacterium]
MFLPAAAPSGPPQRGVTKQFVLLAVAGLVAFACISGGVAALVAAGGRADQATTGLMRPTSTPSPGGIFEASEVRNPYSAAPLGAPVRIRASGRELHISVASVQQDALLELLRLGIPVAPPDPNFDYLLIKLRIQYVSGPPGAFVTPLTTQEVMAQGQTWGRSALAPSPPPPFSGAVLPGPGASHEGYLPPAIVPKAGQAEAVLSLQLQGVVGEIWLRLG